MDRRDFLTTTLAGASGAAVIPAAGCGTSRHAPTLRVLSDAEGDDIMARLTRALASVETARFATGLVSAARSDLDAELREHLANADALAVGALRGLVIADIAGEATRDARPGERLMRHFESLTPALDDTLASYTALLERAPVRAKQRVDEVLHAHDDIPMRIGEQLDIHGAQLAVTADGRGKMRRIFSEITARSRAQSFSTVADDYVAKVHRIAAQRGQDVALARVIASSTTVNTLWRTRSGAPPEPPATADAGTESTPGSRTVGVGGAILGISAAAGLLGAALLDSGAGLALVVPAVIGGTVGVLTLLVGLIMLISEAASR